MLTYSIDLGPPIALVCLQGYILKDFFLAKELDEVKDRIEEGRVITCTRGRVARFTAPRESLNEELGYHIETSNSDIIRIHKIEQSQGMVDAVVTVQLSEDIVKTVSLFKSFGKNLGFVDVDLHALYKIFRFSYPGRENYLIVDVKKGEAKLVYDGYYCEYIPLKESLQDEIKKRIVYFKDIKGIVATGDVGEVLGLEERLGISVEVMHPLRRIYALGPEAVNKGNYLSTALGLAI